MSGPQIFDRGLLQAREARAEALGRADFLHTHVASELSDRLALVQRTFTRTAELGGRWRVLPGATASAIGADETITLEPGAYDLIVSGLALHFVNDLPGVLVQVRRALKPDGLFLAALFGGDTLAELRQAFAQAESEIEGGMSPRVAPFADVRELGALLQRAGFALPVVDADKLTVRYDNVVALMHDLRRMGSTNILRERRRTPLRRRTLLRMAEIYGERFADGDGRLRATFEIVWLSGWSPHESQQQPLKPGSAKHRLADALNAREIPSGEKP